jgi:hypothetical protein
VARHGTETGFRLDPPDRESAILLWGGSIHTGEGSGEQVEESRARERRDGRAQARRGPKATSPRIGSNIAGTWPKNGTVALPGLVGTAPGKGVMTIEPVSVCL